MKGKGAIGIFDSGVGGLTVAKEVIRLIPYEDIVYFGDTARVPYGNKSKKMVAEFSSRIVRFLLRKKVKFIVVACNTASSYALAGLKKDFSIPIVGVVEPGVQKALKITRNGRIGIIGTEGTIRSHTYEKLFKKLDSRARVYSQACPLFVPLAEEGWFNNPVTLKVAQHYLNPLRTVGVDTLVLGCTHYPLLRDIIQKVMGKKVRLVDSAEEVAGRVKEMSPSGKRKRKIAFYVSDEPEKFVRIGKRFLGQKLNNVKWVRLS